jgi:UDP:flavonoid glycosyltransferase YjiC (YdhE family)
MARILMTWELGAGLGHLVPLLTLAGGLRSRGHQVEMALRDPDAAEPFLRRTGIPCHAIPAPPRLRVEQPLTSFARILWHVGFDSLPALHKRVNGWQTLFNAVRPDLLVCDHSPTALLAARIASCKTIVTGTGFTMPPDVTPLPDLLPQQATDPALPTQYEMPVLDNINTVLQESGSTPLLRLSQLFQGNAQALCTLRELDNYANWRRQSDYWGPVTGGRGAAPAWPPGSGPRIFAYLRRFETLPALLQLLRDSGKPALIYMSDQPTDIIAQFDGGNLHFARTPPDMHEVASQCELAILHGGHGATAALLLAGKPMLLLPLYLEMLLTAQAVAGLGAGLVAPERKPAGMRQKLAWLLEEPAFGAAARVFAERYADLDVKAIPSRFAALVEHILGQ